MIVTTADTDPILTDRIAVVTDFRLKDSVKSIPGARWNPDSHYWTVPLSWPSCLALRAEFGDGLQIKQGLMDWATYTKGTKASLLDNRNRLTLVDDDLPDKLGFKELFPFQRVGGRLIADAGRYILFDETGTGKTRTALAGLSTIEEDGGSIFPLMVIAPKSMLHTWDREIRGFFPDVTINVVVGTPTKVRVALEPGADVYIISYDTMRRYSRHAPYPTVKLLAAEKVDKEINEIPLNSIIADECHRVKNPKSKQTRALWHIGNGVQYKIGLTGSPIQDTPEDLWSLLRFIAPDEYPFKSGYVDRFLDVDFNRWGGREIKGLDYRTKDEFMANLDTRTRRITKEVALPFLPPKVFETRWVTLPPKLRKAYDSMSRTLIAELEESTLEAGSVLEKAGRLLQLANAGGEVDADGVYSMTGPSPKIDSFLDDVANGDFDGQQVVVFSDSRQLIDLLSTAMTKKKLDHDMITGSVTGEDRQNAMDRFQAGAKQFILLTRAGGEGITLTAASTMVRLVRSWSYTVHTQSEDRVHRIGSEIHDSVVYIDYITEDTVEPGQMARLYGKGKRAQEILRDEDLLAMLKGTDDGQ